MSKRSFLRALGRTQEEAVAAVSANLQTLNDAASSSDEEPMFGASSEQQKEADNDKKTRIPWDRDPRGDKNGLKTTLLNTVREGRYHIEGGLMQNFREISKILSTDPTSPFVKFNGIERSGAQRKFNQIVREMTQMYVSPEGEIQNENEATEYERLALEIIRDLIEKEKSKVLSRASRAPQGKVSVDGEDGEEEQGLLGEESASSQNIYSGLLKKRRSEGGIIPVKGIFRKVARAEVESSMLNADGEALPRISLQQHHAAVDAIKKKHPSIATVADVLKAADLSPKGIADLFSATNLKPDKPMDRILRLYEEVCEDREYAAKCKSLFGLSAADALELDVFLRAFYSSL
eukprot:gene29086-35104_t